jgi:hypothetical protein
LYYEVPYVHPDVVPGKPLYLYGHEYPQGESFNTAAFAPPAGAQGDLGRNVIVWTRSVADRLCVAS